MKILILIIVISLPLWFIWGFFKFRLITRGTKVAIRLHLASGLTLFDAIKKAFLDLNMSRNLGLHEITIEKVSSKIANLETIMDTDNVVEIYLTFIWRYIFRDGRKMKPTNLEDQKIIYALENLDFNEKNGFYVIKPDTDYNEIDKKLPN